MFFCFRKPVWLLVMRVNTKHFLVWPIFESRPHKQHAAIRLTKPGLAQKF